MLGRQTTIEGIANDVNDIESRMSFIANRFTDGIVSGLEVTIDASMAIHIAPGSFILRNYLSSLTSQITLEPLASTDSHGFVVIEVSEVTVSAKDGFGVNKIVRTDLAFTPKVVAAFDSSKQLLLGVYNIITREKYDTNGNIVYVSQTYSKTATINSSCIYAAPDRNLSNVAVTGFTFVQTPVATNTYFCDPVNGVFHFAWVDQGRSVSISYDALVPKTYTEGTIDTSTDYYPTMRQVATVVDVRHDITTNETTLANAHGTSFNDVAETIPLHRLVYDTGFSVYHAANRTGIPGTIITTGFVASLYTAATGSSTSYRFSTDLFGEDTGNIGDQFIQIPGFPLRILSVVNGTTNQPLPYYVHKDNVCFDSTILSHMPTPVAATGSLAFAAVAPSGIHVGDTVTVNAKTYVFVYASTDANEDYVPVIISDGMTASQVVAVFSAALLKIGTIVIKTTTSTSITFTNTAYGTAGNTVITCNTEVAGAVVVVGFTGGVDSVTISYAAITDFAPKTSLGNKLSLYPNTSITVFSEGRELSQSTTGVDVSFAKYTGLPIDVSVALDSSATPIISPKYLDSGLISDGQSSLTSAIELPYASRVTVTLKDSSLVNPLKPPTGYLKLKSSLADLYGTWRFAYKYFKAEKYRVATYITTKTISDEIDNFDGAKVFRIPDASNTYLTFEDSTEQVITGFTDIGNNQKVALDRSSWIWIDGTSTIALASDIYKAYTGQAFVLYSPESTSERNVTDYVECVGTSAAPSGDSATAKLTLTGAAFTTSDSFTLTLPDGSSLTETYFSTGFTGTTIAEIAASIMSAFATNILVGSTSSLHIQSSADTVSFFLNTSASISTLNLTAYSENNMFQVTATANPTSEYVYQVDVKILGTGLGSAYITISPDANSGTVTLKFYDPANSVSGDSTEVFGKFANLLTANSAFTKAGLTAVAASDGSTLTFTAAPGSDGNSLSLTASTKYNPFSITSFAGGSDTPTISRKLLDGVELELVDGYTYDQAGTFVVYATNEITNGNSKTAYASVCEVSQSISNIYEFTLSKSYAQATNAAASFDTTDEFSLSVQISGSDTSGTSMSETITITPLNFCEYYERKNGKPNNFQFVRSQNTYAKLSSWTVTSSTNAGDCTIYVLADNVSGVRGLFPVLSAFWDGAGLRNIVDKRVFVPCLTLQDTASLQGESLSSLGTLMGFVNEIYGVSA